MNSEKMTVRYAAIDGGDEVTVYAFGPPDHGPAVEVCYGPVMTIPTPDGNAMNFLRIERDLEAIFDAIRHVNLDGGPNAGLRIATKPDHGTATTDATAASDFVPEGPHVCGSECEED